MGLTLKYEHPAYPTGDDAPEIGITSLGRVRNGETLEIDEDMERLFVASRGMTVADAFVNDPVITLSGDTTLSQEEVDQIRADDRTDEELGITPKVDEEAAVEQPAKLVAVVPPQQNETTDSATAATEGGDS